MAAQSKASTPSNLKTAIDILAVGVGIFFGGILALFGLLLWFDRQANPVNSNLAQISTQIISILPANVSNSFSAETQLMGLPLTGQTSAYWYMARSGGIVSYLLIWFSVVWGLVLSTKITAKLLPVPIAYGLHQFLSILALLFTVLHAGVLLGDEYIKFNISHLIIPFSAPYKPFWTGLGTVAFYLSIALTGSFYIRKSIGQKSWRLFHYLAFLLYVLALVHGLMAGTDGNLLGTGLMYWSTGFVVMFLVYYRLFTLKGKTKKRPVRVRL